MFRGTLPMKLLAWTGVTPKIKPHWVGGKDRWYVHRQHDSHVMMHKAGSQNLLVIPLHTSDMPRGTLRGIVDDAGQTVDGFIDFLKQ